MRLVASLIVRNEMERYLPLAVSHLLSFVDEIRVLDDGSDDGTYEWLSSHEPDVIKVMRNDGPTFFEHEGRARQRLLDWTWEGRPDYVLAIDADEFVGEPDALCEALSQNSDVLILHLVEAWKIDHGGISIRVDGLWGPRKVPILYRAPRIAYGRTWKIADRKLACGREPIEVVRASRRGLELDVDIYHFGWVRQAERQARAERYFEHDGGNFHQNRHLQSILYPDNKVGLKGKPWPAGLRPFADRLIAYSEKE